ncbi:complement C1q-like protein 2 [Embiotoca jacksoni]|uniref:complement C1q-like protein 2 n=1 Tax=Embiotoca jacksoni TaxID=100190 RepID=UPI003704503E
MRMNLTILLFVSLFCGSTLAENDGNSTDKEVVSETQLCFSDTCSLLKEFGAMREKLSALENRLKDSETQIHKMKNKETTTVVFSAAIGGNGAIGPFSKDTTIIFRKVITNIGNAYNQYTGIFAAPVAGIYYFTFFHHAGGTHRVSLNLIQNNQVVVEAYDHQTSHDGADNGGNAVFLQLQQGEQVFVRLNANTHVWGNDYVTTFSGFLLKQD